MASEKLLRMRRLIAEASETMINMTEFDRSPPGEWEQSEESEYDRIQRWEALSAPTLPAQHIAKPVATSATTSPAKSEAQRKAEHIERLAVISL